MTRRGYLIQLGVAAVLFCILLLIRIMIPPLPEPQDGPPGFGPVVVLLHNLHWIVLGLIILFGIEASIVLRRFAREEARQKQQAAAAAEQPPPQRM
jgi:hypothetical protein